MKTKDQVINKITKDELKGKKLPDFGLEFKVNNIFNKGIGYRNYVAKRMSELFYCSFEVGLDIADSLYWNNSY